MRTVEFASASEGSLTLPARRVLGDLDELEFVGMGGLGPLPMAAEAADGERLTFTVPPSSWAVRRLLALACFDGQLSLDGGST